MAREDCLECGNEDLVAGWASNGCYIQECTDCNWWEYV